MSDRVKYPWLGPEVAVAGTILVLVWGTVISRHFGWFFFALVVVPFLLPAMLICIAWSRVYRPGARSIPLALVIGTLTWALPCQVQAAWDWTGVTLWSLTHRANIAANAGKDAILLGWADWGWPDSTFAYVIFDARDDSHSLAGAERWRQRLHLDCPIDSTRRSRAHIYFIQTSDCPFDSVALPN